jgi:hypothetical protein
MAKYSSKQVSQIIKGYKLLDRNGALSSLLEQIAMCTTCALTYPSRDDHPVNALVRPLRLAMLSTENQIIAQCKAIERDDYLLRTIFKKAANLDKIVARLGSCKFTIGLLPWLDRCMLFRRSEKTKLMIIGIDYKHFPPFHANKREHCFPLDNYRKPVNTWGPTWRNFWGNLLGGPYDDDEVNKFLEKNGVFMTNSMLCFGGSDNPKAHFYGYLECCRNYIRELLRLIEPEIVVSFGKFGCENAASIFREQNIDSLILGLLSNYKVPFNEKIRAIVSDNNYKEGIHLDYNTSPLVFWLLYQPALNHLHRYKGDYEVLRRLLGLNCGQQKLSDFSKRGQHERQIKIS